MGLRSVSCASALAAIVLSSAVALAEDAKKYPDWEGLWNRGSPVGTWDPTKPGGPRPAGAAHAGIPEGLRGQPRQGQGRHPVRHQGHLRAGRHAAADDDVRADGDRDQAEDHLHAGRIHEPDPPHLYRRTRLPEHEASDPAFVGYSIGKWLDTDNDGTYDTLEIETRNMRGPRLFEFRSAFRSPRTTRPSSRRSSISTSRTPTCCATRSPPSTTR